MQALLGFTPDADATAAGVMTACENMIPHELGMQSASSGVIPAGIPALAASCNGASAITKLDGVKRLFAGTQTKLYEMIAEAWSDVSAGAPTGVYTGGVDSRWVFAQFGNSTLASNNADVIQRSTGGVFAPIAYALKAKIIFSVGAFMMALNTSDATYGVSPDRWWCSASYNDADWTPSVSTLATTGELVSTPGELTAGGRLGEYAVAYKEKAIYLGQFVGAPAAWDWLQVIGDEAGCVGINAWCDIGGVHFIVGRGNFWLFDGSRPVAIGGGQVRRWFYVNSEPNYLYKTQAIYDRANDMVWVFYVAIGSTTLSNALVYNIKTKQWGAVALPIESVLNYTTPSQSIHGMATPFPTIDSLAGISFDSAFWNGGSMTLGIFNTAHQIQLLTGPGMPSGFTTGDLGDDDTVSLLQGIRIRFSPDFKPASASVQTFSKMESGDSLSTRASGTVSDGKFDVLQSARWHRAKFSFTGTTRVLGIAAKIKAQGKR